MGERGEEYRYTDITVDWHKVAGWKARADLWAQDAERLMAEVPAVMRVHPAIKKAESIMRRAEALLVEANNIMGGDCGE